jgi:6-phosphogluconolactonase
VSVQLYETPEALAEAAARAFVDRAAESIAERGRFAVALAGGSTPKATYGVLARDHAEDVDWPNVHVFFGDERTVPPDHEDSNYRMAREALLDRVPVGSIHRMRGELQPNEAAASYETDLRQFFEGEAVLDLVMLGIGDDGHTASLFPETPALEVTDRLAVANPVPKLDTTRLTLTAPVLSAARAVNFLVAGEGKAEALREILEGDADPRRYPAKLVRPLGGPTWLVDRTAAQSLQDSA